MTAFLARFDGLPDRVDSDRVSGRPSARSRSAGRGGRRRERLGGHRAARSGAGRGGWIPGRAQTRCWWWPSRSDSRATRCPPLRAWRLFVGIFGRSRCGCAGAGALDPPARCWRRWAPGRCAWHLPAWCWGRALLRDSAPGALVGFFATAVLLSLTGQSLTIGVTAWVVVGVVVLGRLIGYRKVRDRRGRGPGPADGPPPHSRS